MNKKTGRSPPNHRPFGVGFGIEQLLFFMDLYPPMLVDRC